MDKGKLKVLVMALKEIVEELESEVYSDVDAYKSPATFSSAPMSYDEMYDDCLLYTSPSPRDYGTSRMPSSA